jgi:hypothetical protein
MDGPSRGRQVASWLWAFIPLLSLGLGTVPAMIWAAVRKRHFMQILATAGYTALLVACLVVSDWRLDGVVNAFLAVNWLAASVHALTARRWVFDLPPAAAKQAVEAGPETVESVEPPATDQSLVARQRAVLAATSDEKQARDFARQLAADEPAQAYRLQIGRVDIPDREFPDGGLIDVNNVPAMPLAEATGLPLTLAERIAAVAKEAGGFGSLEELCALTQLPPQTFDHLAGRLYFPRRLPT